MVCLMEGVPFMLRQLFQTVYHLKNNSYFSVCSFSITVSHLKEVVQQHSSLQVPSYWTSRCPPTPLTCSTIHLWPPTPTSDPHSSPLIPTLTLPDDLAGTLSLHIHHCTYISPSISDTVVRIGFQIPCPSLLSLLSRSTYSRRLSPSNKPQIHEVLKKQHRHMIL